MLEISIGALSHRTGLPVSTIRFYDDNGLIQSNRNGGGHDRFERAQIRRVSFMIAAQKFGYTLPQIKTLLDSLPNERTPTVEDWAQLSEKFQKSLDEKIENLQNLRDMLSDCIGCGCLSLKSCGLHNPQDVLGQDWVWSAKVGVIKKTRAKLGPVQQGGSISIPGYARDPYHLTT